VARTCEDRRRFAAAARFTAGASESDPKLGDDLRFRHRHQPAGRAALAGVGQGEDDPRPDEAARTQFRAQACGWFRADLALFSTRLETDNANDRKTNGTSLRIKALSPNGLRQEIVRVRPLHANIWIPTCYYHSSDEFSLE
jgi:hypothetical protein